MTTLPNIMDRAALVSLIDSIADRGKILDHDIHVSAVQSLMHFKAHGDATLATRLVKAMPKAGRMETLKSWFTAYAPLAWSKDQFVKNTMKSANPFDIAEANEHPFWETKEVTAQVFSLAVARKMIIAAANRIDKELKANEDSLSEDEAAAIAALRAKLPVRAKVDAEAASIID